MSDEVVTARPIRSSKIAWTASAVVLVAFIVTALVMKHANAGASFDDKDQFGTVVIGIVLAGLLIMPTRPRLVADRDGLRLRAFLGGWRTVPWELVVRVDFPSKLRFARIVLPGEEALAIYAVQRLDKESSVATMAALRSLWSQTHPQA
ncbi:PH domain-containing protein [Jatrophihabitans sp.]|uniref:PH domain-containing protein n=1 Tax=Jatrophihabitans sp. TaxID=1932789 RepID=UPI0030C6A479|nr:conserved hypothetical rane protein [Jatrophihabitans sp.]